MFNLFFRQGGKTPLHFACHKSRKEIAVALMDRGADIHIKDDEVGINNT